MQIIYSNSANVVATKHDFSIEFGTIIPILTPSEEQGKNIVVPQYQASFRVFHSPSHFKSLVAAMTDQLQKYEEAYGVVENKVEKIDK